MRPIKFRAWNGESMEYGGFSIHAVGHINPFPGITRVTPDSPVMQFTGLLDKNGVEIYESDLISLDGGAESEIGEVIFEDGCFCFKASWIKEGKKYPELKYYTEVQFVDCEVIGNIHEHPLEDK